MDTTGNTMQTYRSESRAESTGACKPALRPRGPETAMTTNESTMDGGLCHSEHAQGSRHDPSSEQALIAAAQAGFTGAMDELLVRHKTALYRAARRFTRSHEDAEDLVQDAMLRAFVNVGKFRGESHFGTWLIAIVNNAALSKKRKGKNVYWFSLDNGKEEFGGLGGWDVPDRRYDPEQEIMRQELLRILHRVILRQSQTHQVMLEQCVFNEARIRDVASSLGLTIGSAKSSLYRARRRVSESFVRRGLVKRRNIANIDMH
jgi:RNA polymerase sigma-70 factor, ECF subfamily